MLDHAAARATQPSRSHGAPRAAARRRSRCARSCRYVPRSGPRLVAALCRCCPPTLARSSLPSRPACRSPPRSRSRASPRSPRSRPPPTSLRSTVTRPPVSSRSPTCPGGTCARSLPVHTPPARCRRSPASRRPPATRVPAPQAPKTSSAAAQRASGARHLGLAERGRAARRPLRRSRRPRHPRQRTRPPPRMPRRPITPPQLPTGALASGRSELQIRRGRARAPPAPRAVARTPPPADARPTSRRTDSRNHRPMRRTVVGARRGGSAPIAHEARPSAIAKLSSPPGPPSRPHPPVRRPLLLPDTPTDTESTPTHPAPTVAAGAVDSSRAPSTSNRTSGSSAENTGPRRALTWWCARSSAAGR